jgi:hypothetical protein
VITDTEFSKKAFDQEASQKASLDIFRWIMINGEGTPPEKVYKDEWVQFEDDSDEETNALSDHNSASHVSDERQNGLKEWLSQTT